MRVVLGVILAYSCSLEKRAFVLLKDCILYEFSREFMKGGGKEGGFRQMRRGMGMGINKWNINVGSGEGCHKLQSTHTFFN